MLSTLVPLFDKDLSVAAYSVFSQKQNPFLNPMTMTAGINDGATYIPGLELIKNMGIETLSEHCNIFVPVSNVSVFSDMDSQCAGTPHDRIVFLIDRTIPPVDMYVNRLKELKGAGYKLAIRKLAISEFNDYAPVLSLMDYVFLNNKKIVIDKAKIFFSKLYPQAKLIAGNIDDNETFETLKASGGYEFYEGNFYRIPVTKGTHELSAMKVTYLELLKTINSPDFELQEAADIIGHDPALTISLLKMVNRVVKTAEITTIRHAAAMLGQKELKKWISTVVTEELYSDKPSELSRIALLRARFAENLASVFNLNANGEELFLMGLFSVLDVILQKPMNEALDMIQAAKPIRDALVFKEGPLAPVLNFILLYESADWHEISRLLVLKDLDMDKIAEIYNDTLIWYRMTLVG